MTARGALTVVGQVVGAYVGGLVGNPGAGAAIGGAVFGAIGGEIDGPMSASGPRLSDLKMTTSQYGTPIPYVEGHPRASGNIIWASDKREIATTTNQGGKGSDATTDVTTYTYEIDLLVLLSATQIVGVPRIWSNSKLVYSERTDAEQDFALVSGSWTEMVVYGGGPSQLPDPTYEAAVGVGNAPAYRGRGTLMLRGLQLGGSGQMPNLTFEVMTSGTPGQPGFTETWDSGLGPYSAISGSMAPFSIISEESVPSGGGEGGGDFTLAPIAGADGPILQVAGGTGVPADVINRSIPSRTANFFSIKFWLDPLAPASSSAAAPYISNAAGTGLSVYGRWITGIDAAHRASVTLNNSVQFLGSTALDLGVWYEVQVRILPGSGNSTVTVINRDTGVTVLVQALTGSFSPVVVDRVGVWRNVGPDLTCTTRVDTLRTGSIAAVVADEDLDDVVSRLCLRAGLTAPQINVTALAGTPVKGFAIGQVTSTRQVLDILAGAYLFEAVESGGVLKFVRRGGASVATIAYADMGASAGDPGEPLPSTRRNDDEAPAQVVVRYSNDSDDGQDGAESSDRLIGFGTGVRMIEVPLTLSPAEARKLADVAIMDVAAATMSVGPVSLTRDYAQLEPTDVVTLTDVDGSTYRVRILKLTESGGIRTLEGNLDDASVVTSVANTSADGYTFSVSVAGAADTVLRLLDIPILRDADNAAGFYAAAKGASTPWPGAKLLGSLDELNYTERAAFTESAVIGGCDTTLGGFSGGNVFDWAGSLTVNVGDGLLASDTRDNLLTLGTNAALVGNDEIIQFLTATLVSAGVYTLTGLLRGRQGTEWAIGGHAAGERFVLLRLAGLRRIANDINEIGALRYYKAVTFGRAMGTAPTQSLINTARGLKPWAPVDLRRPAGAPASIELLLHFNGTNGSTTFTDSSLFTRTVTPSGNAQLSTAAPKYGSAAGLFDGTGDFVSLSTAADWTFLHNGASAWTVETWFKSTVFAAQQTIIDSAQGISTNIGIFIGVQTSRQVYVQIYRGVNASFVIDGPSTNLVPNDGAWHHIAVTFDHSLASGNCIIYIDGAVAGTLNKTGNAPSASAPTFPLRIGAYNNTAISGLNGSLDDFRIAKGGWLYGGAFTPPAAELPNPTSGGADITITWSRRTRLQANFTNGNVPLGEASEAYEVDIFADGTYAVLKRTLSGLSSPSATYTEAQQLLDFGVPQTTIYARVYQRSATVGRGYKLEGAL